MRSDFALFIQQFKRELFIQVRQVRGLVNFCLFFLMILFFFPLTVHPEITLLRTLIPGLVWMSVLLAMLLSAERLFQQDYEQGVIEQWLVCGQSLVVMCNAKIIAHWLFNLLPLLLLTPLIAIFYSLNPWETLVMALGLLCGTPALFFLCALAASFGVGLSQKGALMALVLLPLTLPLLIFGSGSLTRAMQQLPVQGHLALLSAMSLLAVAFLPYAIAGVIRISHAE